MSLSAPDHGQEQIKTFPIRAKVMGFDRRWTVSGPWIPVAGMTTAGQARRS